jgi:peptidoglycan-N-acetylglucosamine deacetylase
MLARLSFVACALCLPCLAQSRTVALTFDDLPAVRARDAQDAVRINYAILTALARHHAPAIGFVIESKLQEIGAAQGREILRSWTAHGHELANHTYSHADLNDLTPDQFRDEVIRGEASLGNRPHWLRFPFNHTGDTKEKMDAVRDFLMQRGYRIAVCTIDNSDYEFARAYDIMLARKDAASLDRLRAEYLSYTASEIDYYTRLHRQVFGHEIPHVMLLHANHLNEAVIDQILQLFEQRRYRFVTLDAAQSDPAYRIPDTFATQYGHMWGYRWAKERGVKVDGKLEPEPPAWVLNYGKSPGR